LRAAIGSRKTGPIFLTANGTRRYQYLVRAAWRPLLGRLGLPYRNPHQLRHSVATALIADGVPLGDVAAYLGDTVQTVVKTYLHPTGTDPAVSLDRLFRTAGRVV
jgi:integrase